MKAPEQFVVSIWYETLNGTVQNKVETTRALIGMRTLAEQGELISESNALAEKMLTEVGWRCRSVSIRPIFDAPAPQ